VTVSDIFENLAIYLKSLRYLLKFSDIFKNLAISPKSIQCYCENINLLFGKNTYYLTPYSTGVPFSSIKYALLQAELVVHGFI